MKPKNPDIVSSVLAGISDDLAREIVDMAVDLVNIPSPTGEEGPIGDYVGSRFGELGMDVEYQEVEPGRRNVIARWRAGDGPSLLFNGHFDTGMSGREKGAPFGLQPRATRRGDWIYGLGVSNMKSAFACYYGAIRLLQSLDLAPGGDVTVAGVIGETEKAPIGSYEGVEYRGGGWGTMFASLHGVLADTAIIGEPTGLRLQAGNSSYIFARVRSFGHSQHTWSKELGDDAIVKAVRVLEALRQWEPVFEASHPHPVIGSRIGFGAIEGGWPFKPCANPAQACDLYLDLRFPPSSSLLAVYRQLREFLSGLAHEDPSLETETTLFLARNGYELTIDEPVVDAVRGAHEAVHGDHSAAIPRYRYDVSADASILHEYGVAGITYGPGGILPDGGYGQYDKFGEMVGIPNLLACTKVYALSLLRLTDPDSDTKSDNSDA